MKNFPIIDKATGREYWISRSVAVVAFVFGYDEDEREYILAEQRGPGTPDPEFRGCWCLPCGYVDFDETIEEAASREVFEETGLKIDSEDWDTLARINFGWSQDFRNLRSNRLYVFIKEYDRGTFDLDNSNNLDIISEVYFNMNCRVFF